MPVKMETNTSETICSEITISKKKSGSAWVCLGHHLPEPVIPFWRVNNVFKGAVDKFDRYG